MRLIRINTVPQQLMCEFYGNYYYNFIKETNAYLNINFSLTRVKVFDEQ